MDPGKFDRVNDMKTSLKYQDKDKFKPASLNKTMYLLCFIKDRMPHMTTFHKNKREKILKCIEIKMVE
jgi:hypothetical protein